MDLVNFVLHYLYGPLMVNAKAQLILELYLFTLSFLFSVGFFYFCLLHSLVLSAENRFFYNIYCMQFHLFLPFVCAFSLIFAGWMRFDFTPLHLARAFSNFIASVSKNLCIVWLLWSSSFAIVDGNCMCRMDERSVDKVWGGESCSWLKDA